MTKNAFRARVHYFYNVKHPVHPWRFAAVPWFERYFYHGNPRPEFTVFLGVNGTARVSSPIGRVPRFHESVEQQVYESHVHAK